MKRHNAALLCLLASAVVLSCSGDDGDGAPVDAGAIGMTRAEVLAHLGSEVILPTYRAFVPEARALVASLDTYAADPTDDNRGAAQEAWVSAMDVWQEAEMMQLGPLAAMDLAAGGQDVRGEIYAWPSLSLCVVDQRTVGDAYDDPDGLAEDAINSRGLGAIEYLIFNDSPENQCSPVSSINADGTWDSFTPDEIRARRATQAHSLAVLVRREAEGLVSAWEPSGEGFLAELEDPTRSGALYGTAQEGLNAVSDAMFYLDKETKDMKVAEPASLTMCDMPTCPEARESRFADRSREQVLANLRAFQRLYLGGDPGGDDPGFDNLLRELGAGGFADTMGTHVEEAIAAVEAIEGTLVEALETDLDAVLSAHMAIKAVTDDLKTMFVTVLDLEPPNRAAGDTD